MKIIWERLQTIFSKFKNKIVEEDFVRIKRNKIITNPKVVKLENGSLRLFEITKKY
jgi:hypothetical protein